MHKRKSIIIFLTLITLLMSIHTALAMTYIGSINSNKFHYTDCRWANRIYPENAIYFHSRQEALNSGYIPCGVCEP